jgi:hypothetical protein
VIGVDLHGHGRTLLGDREMNLIDMLMKGVPARAHREVLSIARWWAEGRRLDA